MARVSNLKTTKVIPLRVEKNLESSLLIQKNILNNPNSTAKEKELAEKRIPELGAEIKEKGKIVVLLEDEATFTVAIGMGFKKRNEFQDRFAEFASREERIKTSEYYEIYRDLVRECLKGCDNVYDADGNKIQIPSPVSDEILDKLSDILLPETGYDNLITWLGLRCWQTISLNEQEKKTSA